MNTIQTDVLIVGGGGSGCRAAIEAADNGATVLLIVKGALGNSGCTLWVGTSCAVGLHGDSTDSVDASLKDLISYGGYLGNQELARILISDTADRVHEMERWGIDFDRNSAGEISFNRSGAHGHDRNFSFRIPNASRHDYGSPPGIAMLEVLIGQLRVRPNIQVLENTALVDLIKTGDQVVGATTLSCATGTLAFINSKSTILATGTYSQMFGPTTVSVGETGDGQAAAFRAGATLTSMEAHQFVATSTGYLPGTVFRNALGEDFLPRYGMSNPTDWPKEPLVRAVWNEIKNRRGTERNSIFLDMRSCPVKSQTDNTEILWYHKELVNSLLQEGIDISKVQVESFPRAHTTIGGILINAHCETDLPGLYATGAAAGGIYGFARPEGYTSMITLVYGQRAGLYAALAARDRPLQEPDNSAVEASHARIAALITSSAQYKPIELLQKIKNASYDGAWVIKEEAQLKKGLSEIRDLDAVTHTLQASNGYQIAEALEARNLLVCAELHFMGSIERKESRGAFFRSDYPAVDNKNWLKTLTYQTRDREIILNTQPADLKYVALTDDCPYKPPVAIGDPFGIEA